MRASKVERHLLLPIVLFAVTVAACENIALMPRRSIDAPDPPTTITATVDGVDHQLQEIYLRTAGNQYYVVNYTGETRVANRGGNLAVTELKAGDQVRVDLREHSGRRLYADRITVESAAAPGSSPIRTVEGTVERVVPERGFLELRALSGELLTVYVPESSSAATRDRFKRIRAGDVVRLEGERLSEDRLELLAFR